MQAVPGVRGAGVGVAAVPPGLPPAAGSSPAAAVEAVSGLRGSEESCPHLESFPWPGSETPLPWGEGMHGRSEPCRGSFPPDEHLRAHPPGQEVSKANLPPLPPVLSSPSSSSPPPAAELWSPHNPDVPMPGAAAPLPAMLPLGWRCHPVPLAAPIPVSTELPTPRAGGGTGSPAHPSHCSGAG